MTTQAVILAVEIDPNSGRIVDYGVSSVDASVDDGGVQLGQTNVFQFKVPEGMDFDSIAQDNAGIVVVGSGAPSGTAPSSTALYLDQTAGNLYLNTGGSTWYNGTTA